MKNANAFRIFSPDLQALRGMKWQAASPQSIQMKTWGNETVVHDARSGNTHLLGNNAAMLLATLLQAPRETQSLLDALTDATPGQSLDINRQYINGLLAELAGISLISSVPS